MRAVKLLGLPGARSEIEFGGYGWMGEEVSGGCMDGSGVGTGFVFSYFHLCFFSFICLFFTPPFALGGCFSCYGWTDIRYLLVLLGGEQFWGSSGCLFFFIFVVLFFSVFSPFFLPPPRRSKTLPFWHRLQKNQQASIRTCTFACACDVMLHRNGTSSALSLRWLSLLDTCMYRCVGRVSRRETGKQALGCVRSAKRVTNTREITNSLAIFWSSSTCCRASRFQPGCTYAVDG